MADSQKPMVLVTGGAGYVGAELVPQLLSRGYRVRVLDLFLFDTHVFDSFRGRQEFECVRGDIRDQPLLRKLLKGTDIVLHLACISNDPSYELNPELSKSINFDAFEPLVRISQDSGVRRFIYISTSSVYGVSEDPNVTEEHPLVPLTDYNKFKGLCEPILLERQSPDFTTVVIRPATICGYSRRLRLDLSVNILTNHAVNKGKITIFGGSQKRPNIHINDVCDLYTDLLEIPAGKVAGEIFNAGYQNNSLMELGRIVRETVQGMHPDRPEIPVDVTPSNDIRSYHISSEKIARRLGFSAKRTVEDAVRDLCRAFREGCVPNPLEDIRYHNVRVVQEAGLK
jgi:nucleoside-diphosphate-sugar epimerase